MEHTFRDILFIILIFQLLFISFFLFSHNKGRRISHLLLGLFFLSFCLNLADGFLLLKRVYFVYPSFALWASNMPLLYGPLLYLYTQSVLFNDFSFSRRKLIHFFPFIVFTAFAMVTYSIQSTDQKIRILNAVLERNIPSLIYIFSIAIYIQLFIYLFFSLRIVNSYVSLASNKFADHMRTNIGWLRFTILFFMVFMLLGAISGLAGITPWAKYYYLFLTILVAVFFLYINRVLFKALHFPEIFSGMSEKEAASGEGRAVKYASSTLHEQEKLRIKESLLQYMEKSKPYLEPELSLDELAVRLSVQPKILSQVINETLGKSFFDYINGYRIDEAMRLLTNPKDPRITVQEVLYEVGFNSKSSFNTLFKKQTGLTPSEFKKKQASYKGSDSENPESERIK